MNLPLPTTLQDWVEARARTGAYADPADYIRDLIRRDQIRAAKIANMQRLVTEALDSGVSPETMDDIERAATRAL